MSKNNKIGDTTYMDTVASLIECLSAILGGTALSAPTATPSGEIAGSFPLSVALTNPNGSGTIRYTLDGSAPTATSGAVYTGGSITIPSAGTALRAAVFPTGGGLSSQVLALDYQTPGTFFGTDAFDWTITGDRPWMIHTVADVPTLVSGYILADYTKFTCALKATAKEKGTLSFKVIDCGGSNTGTTTVTKPDGTSETFSSAGWYMVVTNSYSFAMDAGQSVALSREGKTRHYYGDTNGPNGPAYNGTFLFDFVWKPDRTETDTPVPVPYAWLDARYPGRAATAAEYDALAFSDEDGDGYPLWAEYLCGTDPDDEADHLMATISIDAAGEPVVDWNLTAPLPGATKTIEGAAELGDPWTTPPPADARFFRIRADY